MAHPDVFNMADMGLRLGGIANGVSKLHGKVSREMFGNLWPGFEGGGADRLHHERRALADVDRPRLASLTASAYGRTRTWLGDAVSDAELWALKREMRATLVREARLAAPRVRLPAGGLGRVASVGGVRARPRHPHHRIRAPRPDVQAPDSDAPRSRATQGAPSRPRAARSDRRGWQGAPARRGG